MQYINIVLIQNSIAFNFEHGSANQNTFVFNNHKTLPNSIQISLVVGTNTLSSASSLSCDFFQT